jgi:hypothetical protein
MRTLPQGLDMGILFATYSLLCQKAATAKKLQEMVSKDSERFYNRHLATDEEKAASAEAATGEAQFGARTKPAWPACAQSLPGLPAVAIFCHE